MHDEELCCVIDLISGVAEDESIRQAKEALIEAQKQLSMCEAQSRRDKCNAIIKSLFEIDTKIKQFYFYYDKIKGDLSNEARLLIKGELDSMEIRKKKLLHEKRRMEHL